MEISFHGADRGVTGSCHMVECDGRRILIDCGLYQGGREIEEDNADDFGFDPASIDFLLLTHAHLDHCGRIPLLAKRGFRGEIITTAASRELARLVMLDAANLQEEEARYQERHKARRGQRPGRRCDRGSRGEEAFQHQGSCPPRSRGQPSTPEEAMNDAFREVKARIRRLDDLLQQGGLTNVDFAQAVSRVRRAAKRGDRSREPTTELRSLLERAEGLVVRTAG